MTGVQTCALPISKSLNLLEEGSSFEVGLDRLCSVIAHPFIGEKGDFGPAIDRTTSAHGRVSLRIDNPNRYYIPVDRKSVV